ncbi:helix-turn-helix domain-containing protein [Neobacillus kokaensis]|uniref:AraC family transcriptional regulator n=1 Tax=Neobacillus kokaensis TaxID=2759023 RepID=A0ABQ3N1Y0_9BACI|nr:helix-turn-helix domain-containing protein [Neobacillus kokaensis]GHH97993.1 AraC family transcriptional regulator [Neobacillus kokaensis]
MMKRNYRIPLVYKYLLFYIVLLILPIFIMGYIIHFQIMTNLKQQVQESNKQKLTQVKDVIDTKLLEIHNISTKISNQPELTPYAIHNFYDVYQAQKLLDYKVGNDFIYDLFYFIRNGKYIYSANSSYSLSIFLKSHFQYKNWSAEDFYQTINKTSKPILRTAEDVTLFQGLNRHLITYVVPVPSNSTTPYGTILFLVKEQVIRDMLKNVVNTPNGNAFILDQKGKIVAGLSHKDLNVSLIHKILKKDSSTGIRSVNIDDQPYFISQVKSNFLDWSYITLTPEKELMKEVNSIRNKVLISYMIILGAGVLIIYFGLHINYKPLRRLIRRAEEKWEQAVDKRDDLDKIWGVMDYTDSMNQQLSERVKNSRPVLQQHLLTRLLRGEIKDYIEFNKLGEEMELTLNEASCFVMVMDFNSDNVPKMQIRSKLINDWLEKLPHIEKYPVNLFETSKVAVIICGEVPSSVLTNWYQECIKNQPFTVTIGVGNSYHELIQIGKSHLEASTALNYKLIKGIDQVIFFKETSAFNPKIQWYDKQIIEQLESSLRKKDKEKVDRILTKMVSIIKSSDTNLYMAKCLSFDISSTTMRIVQDIHNLQTKVEDALPDVFLINDFYSVEEVEKTITNMIHTAFQLVNKSNEIPKLLDELLAYIKEHYYDDQFSIQSLASYFSLSETYIMGYFKKQTGETIWQHLNRLRMDHAKQLLKTTDTPIKDIVKQVGYSDASSFIRKFKQMTELTPGEFRKHYAEKN